MKKGIGICILFIVILSTSICISKYRSNNNYYRMIAAASDGNWVRQFVINEKEIDNKINDLTEWFEQLDIPPQQESFNIIEVIDKEQIHNIDSLYDLCEMSVKFNQFIRVDENTIYKSSKHGITTFSPQPLGKGKNQMYLRKPLLIEDVCYLKIDADYELEKGAMSIELISPDGKTTVISELCEQYSGNTKTELNPGIWCIIYHYTADNDGIINGEQEITISFENTHALCLSSSSFEVDQILSLSSFTYSVPELAYQSFRWFLAQSPLPGVGVFVN